MRRKPRRRRNRELILLCLFITFGLLLHLCLPGPPPPPHAFAATPQHWRSEVERAHDAAAVARRPAVAPEESITYGAPRPDAPPGPMELFTASGRFFPVVVIACDRTETLRDALTSLMAAGASAQDILVAQDGANSAVAAVVAEFGVAHKAKRPPLVPLDGAQHIARTYKFALTRAFEDVFPDAPAVLVVEDDLVVSKDFFDYFSAVAPALERDDSLFVASAWNDNGFAKHGDPGALRRTGWFPGLGWLLPRKLWETDLHPQWPDGHWDHWMRSDDVAKGRECVYPVVNRASHESEYGTFLDAWHDKRYFKTIVHQRSRFDWPSDAWRSVLRDVYEDRVRGLLAAAEHVASVDVAVKGSALATTTPLALWFDFEENDDAPPGAADAWAPPPFVCVSEPFDLWHENRRGDHRGVHEVVGAAGRPVLLVKAPVAYDSLRPDGLTPLARSDCPSVTWEDLGKEG